MKVFHASKYIIESPDVKHSRDLLDFGKGFYLTSLIEQAKKYAQRFLFQGDKAYLNQYILDEEIRQEYKIKEFASYNEEWLDFVSLCRLGKQTGIALDDALDFFYSSNVYLMISKGIADMHCRSDGYLAELLKEEWEKKSKIA